MLKSITLQNILLPETPEMQECESLFFRDGLSKELPEDRHIPEEHRWEITVSNGSIVQDNRMLDSKTQMKPHTSSEVRYEAESKCLVIPAGHIADLSCYFNMLSASKWLKSTFVENFTLNLDLQGDALVDIAAYKLPDFTTLKQIAAFNDRRYRDRKDDSLVMSPLTSISHSSTARESIAIPIGHPNVTLAGAIITAKSEVRLYGGTWEASIESEHIRDVDLCIATTTFQKEEFITRNVQAMKDLAVADPEFGAHFQMIVVDNGRTLDPASFEDEHVKVFGNMNAGGSGGFARGMIEALRAEKKPTHLLLMDDDVLILPESIKRVFTLLTLLRPEYQKHYLSGAMLRLENKDIQHEDIGFVHRQGFYAPKKGVHSLKTIIDCACNEVEWPDFGYEYCGWWFCCIPMEFISEDSLPVPFFIKVDDAEYSFRNDARVLTMNGICVWHMGFMQKFSAGMDYHQVTRNTFIMLAFDPTREDIDFIEHDNMLINQLLNVFAYDYVDLVLDGIEDYLKGPSILEKPNGIEIVKEKSAKNEVLAPLAEVWTGEADFGKVFDRRHLGRKDSVVKRKMVTFSRNGQERFQGLVDDKLGFAPHDWEYNHETIFFKDRLLVINPGNLTGLIRERDPERFAEVVERRNRVFAKYEEMHEQVNEEYRKAYPTLTSIAFWKNYLGIE